MGRLFWMSAFLDFAPAAYEPGIEFWGAVTGSTLSPARGDAGEFATLIPPDGDAFLRTQRLAAGASRLHLDLHVDDPHAAAQEAIGWGGVQIADHGYVVMSSPAGLIFCFVSHPASVRPMPVDHGGHTSLVDQVCLDVGASAFEAECEFWAAITGWEPIASRVSPSFRPHRRPEGQPLRLMIQRCEDERPAGAHLDLAVSDRAAEAERHRALGAHLVGVHSHWTVLRDPAGLEYCLTDRDPVTGVLP